MSVVTFRFLNSEGYPSTVIVPRIEVRGYEFTFPDDHPNVVCLEITVTTMDNYFWVIPIDGWVHKTAHENRHLADSIGARLAASLDPSSPDVDISWTFSEGKWKNKESR